MNADALQAYLDEQGAGLLERNDTLVQLLQSCWMEFDGSSNEGMYRSKLSRLEIPEWGPPRLKFQIMRHGRTVQGSTRGEIQHWTLDLGAKTASGEIRGYRQLEPRAKSLDVRPFAREVAQKILQHTEDPRLRWLPDSGVPVLIGNVVPAVGFNRTVEGRRKRFKSTLEEELQRSGWYKVGPNTYQRLPL